MTKGIRQVVVAGPGFMGQLEARAWREISQESGLRVRYLVDQTDAAQEFSRTLSAELVVMPPPLSGKGFTLSFAREVTSLAHKTDIWSIAVPTWLHYVYLELVLNAGVKKVFIEKPSTDSTEKSCKVLGKYPDALIQVDYVERGHPVVLAIRDRMQEIGFKPTNMFNWRSRDTRNISVQRINSGDETKITVADLLHDISEVDFLLKSVTGLGLDKGSPSLKSIKMVRWVEKYPEYPYPSDLTADFTILFSNGVEARIRGEADFDFRRYFVIWNKNTAFFGQTLARPKLGITPVAAQVEGAENVARLLQIAESGRIVTDMNFQAMFHDTDAQVLNLSNYEENPVIVMVKNLADAKQNSDLICSLADAIAIEDIVERVYKESGNEELLTSRVVVS